MSDDVIGLDVRWCDIEKADLVSMARQDATEPMTTQLAARATFIKTAAKLQVWLADTAAAIHRAIAARIEAMAAGGPAALAHDLTLRAALGFAPHHIGGAPLFYRPAWVKWFEKDTPGWCYEDELLLGRGALYFPLVTGMKLWERLVKGVGETKPFSRRGQGGEFQTAAIEHEGHQVDVVRFVPDAKPYVESLIVVPGGKPARSRKLLLPNGVGRPAWGGA